jgi:hypothetical protein
MRDLHDQNRAKPVASAAAVVATHRYLAGIYNISRDFLGDPAADAISEQFRAPSMSKNVLPEAESVENRRVNGQRANR